jgi:CheY-like chemotaxis protein
LRVISRFFHTVFNDLRGRIHNPRPGASEARWYSRAVVEAGVLEEWLLEDKVVLCIDAQEERGRRLHDLSDRLEGTGRVEWLQDGGEALERLEQQPPPHVVVIDAALAEPSAVEVARRVQEIPQLEGCVSIIVGDDPSASLGRFGAAAGCKAYVADPDARVCAVMASIAVAVTSDV